MQLRLIAESLDELHGGAQGRMAAAQQAGYGGGGLVVVDAAPVLSMPPAPQLGQWRSESQTMLQAGAAGGGAAPPMVIAAAEPVGRVAGAAIVRQDQRPEYGGAAVHVATVYANESDTTLVVAAAEPVRAGAPPAAGVGGGGRSL